MVLVQGSGLRKPFIYLFPCMMFSNAIGEKMNTLLLLYRYYSCRCVNKKPMISTHVPQKHDALEWKYSSFYNMF